MASTPNPVASARKALAAAENFSASVTQQAGNKENPFKPKADYVHAREARKIAAAPPSQPHEFMGVRENQAPELNTALEAREQAKKALTQ